MGWKNKLRAVGAALEDMEDAAELEECRLALQALLDVASDRLLAARPLTHKEYDLARLCDGLGEIDWHPRAAWASLYPDNMRTFMARYRVERRDPVSRDVVVVTVHRRGEWEVEVSADGAIKRAIDGALSTSADFAAARERAGESPSADRFDVALTVARLRV